MSAVTTNYGEATAHTAVLLLHHSLRFDGKAELLASQALPIFPPGP